MVTTLFLFQWIQKELHSFEDVVWHVSWSVSGNILAVSGGDNKVTTNTRASTYLHILNLYVTFRFRCGRRV